MKALGRVAVGHIAADDGAGAGEDALFLLAEEVHLIVRAHKGDVAGEDVEHGGQLLGGEKAAGQLDGRFTAGGRGRGACFGKGAGIGQACAFHVLGEGETDLSALAGDHLPILLRQVLHQQGAEDLVFLHDHGLYVFHHHGEAGVGVIRPAVLHRVRDLIDQAADLIVHPPHHLGRRGDARPLQVGEKQVFFAAVMAVDL